MIEIKKEGDNTFRFTLKTIDGYPLLKSIDYPSRKRLDAIVSQLQTLAEDHMVFERQTNHQGKFLFQLRDLNGKAIGQSQLYNSEAGMENGIKNLKNRIASLKNTNGL